VAAPQTLPQWGRRPAACPSVQEPRTRATMLSRGIGNDKGRETFMEVLACIPELPCLTGTVAAAVGESPRPFTLPGTRISTQEPAVTTDEPDVTDEPDEPDEPEADGEDFVSPPPRRGAVRRSRPSWLFSPSILALAAVAAVVWTAAWRNDRLRLEASRQQRPERLAQELPAAAGAARSVTP